MSRLNMKLTVSSKPKTLMPSK